MVSRPPVGPLARMGGESSIVGAADYWIATDTSVRATRARQGCVDRARLRFSYAIVDRGEDADHAPTVSVNVVVA